MGHRDPNLLVGTMEALAGKESTHVLKRCDNEEVVFEGTRSQCLFVKGGFDIDFRLGHPDNVGKTYVERREEAK